MEVEWIWVKGVVSPFELLVSRFFNHITDSDWSLFSCRLILDVLNGYLSESPMTNTVLSKTLFVNEN